MRLQRFADRHAAHVVLGRNRILAKLFSFLDFAANDFVRDLSATAEVSDWRGIAELLFGGIFIAACEKATRSRTCSGFGE